MGHAGRLITTRAHRLRPVRPLGTISLQTPRTKEPIMSMTRKHYVEVAETIKRSVEWSADETPVRKAARLQAAQEIANGMANMFAYDNGRFDRDRFMNACGLGNPNGN
jgi:hypothetical protein